MSDLPFLDGPFEVPAPRDKPIFGERAWLVSSTETTPPAVVIDYGPEQTRCELDDPQTGGVCQRRLTPRGHCPLHDKA